MMSNGTILIIFVVFFYLIPALIAIMRGHRQKGAIIALNIFLGWTLLGWVGALVWAFTNSGQQTIIVMAPGADGKAQQITVRPPQ
jgi:hypothetical protein